MTEKLRLSNTAISAARDAVKRAKENLQAMIYAVTSICTHDTVGEAPYKSNDYLASLPPMRVCMTCGLVEQGWHCGYIVLTNELAFNLTRDQVYDLRTVQIEQEDKGPLLRREVTLRQMLA
jgi:hypothetical protein